MSTKTNTISRYIIQYLNTMKMKINEQKIILLKNKAQLTKYINQKGGKLDDANNKVNKIREILLLYKDITSGKINDKTQAINAQIDEILKILNDPNLDKIYESLNDQEAIMNNLDIMKHVIVNAKESMQLNQERVTIKVPELQLNNRINKVNYDDIFKKIKQDLSEASKNKVSDKRQYDIDIGVLEKKITSLITDLGKHQSSLVMTVDLLKKNNSTQDFEDLKIENIKQALENDMKLEEILKTIMAPQNNISKEFKSHFFDIDKNLAKLEKEYQEKKIKEKQYNRTKRRLLRDFTRQYNIVIKDLENNINLPDRLFDGSYTIRINNNILLQMNIQQNLNNILGLLNIDPKIEKEHNNIDNLHEYFNMIYDPTKIFQKGGNIENSLLTLDGMILNYNKSYQEYQKEVELYNTRQLHKIFHSIFLVLISTNQLFTNNYVIYDYINLSILELYKRIVKNITKKIKENVRTPEILYFKKYHYITLIKLEDLLDKITPMITSKDIINISQTKGELYNRFFLLNYFKTILEIYNEQYQNKITIYSRINDIVLKDDEPFTPEEQMNKMYLSGREAAPKSLDSNINKLMYVRKNACNSIQNPTTDKQTKLSQLFTEPLVDPVKTYKFTEVFDTKNFEDSGVISKYMTLDTQLENGKGVAIITYGYSGVGKTFTLFGSSELQEKGMLQDTLDSISGLNQVKFRLFELYGHGLPYSNYWKHEDDPNKSKIDEISHYIYTYKLNILDNTLNVINTTVINPQNSGFSNFINDQNTYFEINGNVVSQIFKNFDMFMKQIEDIREKNQRIRDTPNNKVSSRSVLIYDFQLEILDNKNNKKTVPFLIIDLPGREEIVQTYVDQYLGNKVIQDLLNKKNEEMIETKFLLTNMALNPLGIAIMEPDIIINKFNNSSDQDRSDILLTRLKYAFPYNEHNDKVIVDHIYEKYDLTDKKITNPKEHKQGFIFGEELINRKIFNMSGNRFSVWDIGSLIKINNNKIEIKDYKSTQLFGYTSQKQQNSLIALHIMNRLIRLNKFAIIASIYKEIIDNKINNVIDQNIKNKNIKQLTDDLIQTNFKGELLKSQKEINIQTLQRILHYDYYLTPFEGIYINENIIGLIKFLAGSLIKDDKVRQKYLENKIQKQDLSLNFAHQQRTTRTWLITKDSRTEKDIKEFFGYKNEQLNIPEQLYSEDNHLLPNNIKIETDKLENSYKSDKIFNFDKPLITDVLEKYIKEIKDFKIFYLFGNNKNQELNNLKCEHQLSLLNNTSDFIDIIVSTE
jgi:hypothetical protein